MSASTCIPLWMFLSGLAAWTAIVWAQMLSNIRSGSWLGAFVATLFASAVPVDGISVIWEHRSLWEMLDPRTQAWAFIFGDHLALPFAAAMAALAFRRLPSEYWWGISRSWTTCTVFIGLGYGVWFHWLGNEPNYARADALKALNSASSLAHDGCAVPVLSGVLVATLLPLLLRHMRDFFVWLALGSVAIWVGLSVIPTVKLDPTKLHPNWWTWPASPGWPTLIGIAVVISMSLGIMLGNDRIREADLLKLAEAGPKQIEQFIADTAYGWVKVYATMNRLTCGGQLEYREGSYTITEAGRNRLDALRISEKGPW